MIDHDIQFIFLLCLLLLGWSSESSHEDGWDSPLAIMIHDASQIIVIIMT